MFNIFDNMAAVCGYLNILNKNYNNNPGTIRTLSSIPDFISTVLDMYAAKHCYEEDIKIKNAIITGSGDNFFPIYITVVEGLKNPHVERIPIKVDYKSSHGMGIALLVYVPSTTFESNDIIETISILKDLYFKILDFDKAMTYKASPSILLAYSTSDIEVPIYDVEMTIIAICFITINIKDWFESDDTYLRILDVFDYPDHISNNIINVVKNCYNTSDIRELVSSGKILSRFVYNN